MKWWKVNIPNSLCTKAESVQLKEYHKPQKSQQSFEADVCTGWFLFPFLLGFFPLALSQTGNNTRLSVKPCVCRALCMCVCGVYDGVKTAMLQSPCNWNRDAEPLTRSANLAKGGWRCVAALGLGLMSWGAGELLLGSARAASRGSAGIEAGMRQRARYTLLWLRTSAASGGRGAPRGHQVAHTTWEDENGFRVRARVTVFPEFWGGLNGRLAELQSRRTFWAEWRQLRSVLAFAFIYLFIY